MIKSPITMIHVWPPTCGHPTPDAQGSSPPGLIKSRTQGGITQGYSSAITQSTATPVQINISKCNSSTRAFSVGLTMRTIPACRASPKGHPEQTSRNALIYIRHVVGTHRQSDDQRPSTRGRARCVWYHHRARGLSKSVTHGPRQTLRQLGWQINSYAGTFVVLPSGREQVAVSQILRRSSQSKRPRSSSCISLGVPVRRIFGVEA